MMLSEVGSGPSLESAANASEVACGIQWNSYASTYMQINCAHLSLGHLSLVRMDRDSEKRR
jgi:hypothetical protein